MLVILKDKVMLINKHPQLVKAYRKAIDTVESCQTKEQLEVASKLVENFKIMYKQVGYPKALSYSLDRAIKRKKL
jgi:hypothetical protein